MPPLELATDLLPGLIGIGDFDRSPLLLEKSPLLDVTVLYFNAGDLDRERAILKNTDMCGVFTFSTFRSYFFGHFYILQSVSAI